MEYIVGGTAFIAAVVVLFFAVRALARVLFGRRRRLERDLAIDVLRDRLTRGEITNSEYDDAVAAVGKG